MAGFTPRRLVLVLATHLRNGSDAFVVGTGYFLTSDLVLTASHVVPEEGMTRLEVRTENDGEWREASLTPVWRDAARDALLLRVLTPLPDVDEPDWLEGDVDADAVWHSSGYPDAGKIVRDGRPARKTVGLSGKLLSHGGGGQGPKELELTVESPPPADQWTGISGAPVFVRDRLAGIVTEVPRSFQGGRLMAVPISALLRNHGFRLALSPPWPEAVTERVWVLAVLSEAKKGKGLADWVDRALSKDYTAIDLAVGTGLRPKCVRLEITDALESPGRWLRFLTVLCSAPIAVFDATGFEPAVMLALGIRAVVRRGVTLTSSAEELTPAQLSQLPFNIQETKLIHHGGAYAPNDVKHPRHTIGAAIKRGWQELDSQPHYLDLPAYDAVRGPYPAADTDGQSSITRILVLCPFAQVHHNNWLRIANALVFRYGDVEPTRMLDIASPRLVGQALYEGIRWARTCVVDWTGWRANVFFELGVRLAAADISPVCVIEKGAADAVTGGQGLKQLALLTTLIGPASYSLDDDDNEGLRIALAVHDAIVDQHPPAAPASQLPHDATFRTCLDWFDWSQERITMDPHEFLRVSIESPFGKDVQAAGRSPLLFSANEGYSKGLDRSVKERWLAAWFYITGRYPKETWKVDAALRATVKKLANDVLQFGLSKGADPVLNALRDSIFDALDEIDDIDRRNADGDRNAS
jgi:hypothetical protein